MAPCPRGPASPLSYRGGPVRTVIVGVVDWVELGDAWRLEPMSPEADRREPPAPSRSGGPSGDPGHPDRCRRRALERNRPSAYGGLGPTNGGAHAALRVS